MTLIIQPQVMEEHIAWLQIDEDNENSDWIFTIEVVFEPYSSVPCNFILLLPFFSRGYLND